MSGLKNLKKRRRVQVISIAGACVAFVLVLLHLDDSLLLQAGPPVSTRLPFVFLPAFGAGPSEPSPE